MTGDGVIAAIGELQPRTLSTQSNCTRSTLRDYTLNTLRKTCNAP